MEPVLKILHKEPAPLYDLKYSDINLFFPDSTPLSYQGLSLLAED